MKKPNQESKNYDVQVTRAKEVKEGSVAFDMEVNGITVYGCWYNEYKTKEGKDGTMISFPSYKNGDKYYNHVWFPISKELKEEIISQIEKLV
jgi:DNA-binding cell septation regulator SpoVG